MNSDFGCKREQEEEQLNIINNINCNNCPAAETTTSDISEKCQQQYCSSVESLSKSSLASLSSSPSARKSYCYRSRRFAYASKIIFLLYIIFMFLGTTHAVTFFYGASAPDGDNDKTLRPFGEVSYSEEEMQGPIPDITKEDLETVHMFCKYLPIYEKMGRVRKSRVTRAICERLLVILPPVLSKPSSPSSSNKSLI